MWNEALDRELIALVNEHGRKWTLLSGLFSVEKTKVALKMRYQNYLCDNPVRGKPDYLQLQEPSNPIQKAIQKRKHQFNRDGSETDERVIPEEALQTRESLLIAHSYNPNEFELVNSTSNFWDSNVGDGHVITLYQSKITVKPKAQVFDMETFVQALEDKKEPYRATGGIVKQSERYLVVPSFDTHFDGKTLSQYRESLERTLSFIERNYFNESLLILGGDIINVDTVNNTTTRGTPQETMNINDAFNEMEEYYETIIEALLEYSNKVQVMQLNGNHDNSLGYAFARVLKKAYSRNKRITFDVSLDQRKVHMLGKNMIAGSHGDKAKARYPQLFATEFSQEWARASCRELFTGHLHFESVKDEGGMMHRQMPTAKRADLWHGENGFTMASKRFQLVTYTEDRTEGVHYV